MLTSIRNPCHIRSFDIVMIIVLINYWQVCTQCKPFEHLRTLQLNCTIFVLNWICIMENIFILFYKIWFSHWTFIWIQTELSFKISNHFCKEKSFSSKPLFQWRGPTEMKVGLPHFQIGGANFSGTRKLRVMLLCSTPIYAMFDAWMISFTSMIIPC